MMNSMIKSPSDSIYSNVTKDPGGGGTSAVMIASDGYQRTFVGVSMASHSEKPEKDRPKKEGTTWQGSMEQSP
jgi:2-phospho-L-lactate guanylyltransferase (CobY/MobA/RfbA family)